jgi:hypothetical protein
MNEPNKVRFTFTLDPVIVEKVKVRGRAFGFALSTWINHILARSEGLVDDTNWPRKDIDATKEDE